MTVRILKSEADQIEDFAGKAATHAVEMKNWRAHMARVKADEANPDIDPAARHWPLRQPDAHPLVERAVNENDEMDFELVDDGPTVDQVLRAKKDGLLALVYHAEQAAIAAVVPIGRRRLLNMKEATIAIAHDKRVQADTDTILKSAAAAVGLRKPPKMPAGDQKFVDEQSNRRQAIASIEESAAQAMHDIEDLTIETIDGYQIPDFTKG